MLFYIIEGLVIGFTISLAFGPISLLIMKRTISEGPRAGIAAGFGATCCDTTYSLIAAFGLHSVSRALLGAKEQLGLFGGIALMLLGAFSIRQWRLGGEPMLPKLPAVVRSPFLGTYLLTFASPMTILPFAAGFAALSAVGRAPETLAQSSLLVVGVFIGSITWSMALVVFATLMHRAFGKRDLGWLELATGLAFIGFGLAAMLAV